MIIIKLDDGSYKKISDADYRSLEKNGVIGIKNKLKKKVTYEDKILSFISSYGDSGITLGRIVNRFRSLNKSDVISVLDFFEKDGKIKSVLFIKDHDKQEFLTYFKIN